MTASRGISAARAARNLRIVSLRGSMSFSLIAAEIGGITRDVVAGVLWRLDNPIEVRKRRVGGDARKTGTGHSGPGRYPPKTKYSRPRPGA